MLLSNLKSLNFLCAKARSFAEYNTVPSFSLLAELDIRAEIVAERRLRQQLPGLLRGVDVRSATLQRVRWRTVVEKREIGRRQGGAGRCAQRQAGICPIGYGSAQIVLHVAVLQPGVAAVQRDVLGVAVDIVRHEQIEVLQRVNVVARLVRAIDEFPTRVYRIAVTEDRNVRRGGRRIVVQRVGVAVRVRLVVRESQQVAGVAEEVVVLERGAVQRVLLGVHV